MGRDPAKWPMHAALAVISGRWKLVMICRIRDGITRFGELARSLGTISEKMLMQQLRELERDGLIVRTVVSETPAHVEYSLTPLGEELQPVADAVYAFGVSLLRTRHASEREAGSDEAGAG